MDPKQAEEDKEMHQVLINDEEQYSLWPADKKIPLGWKHSFGPADKEACLAYVREVWTDMRPKSLREEMAKMEKQEKNG